MKILFLLLFFMFSCTPMPDPNAVKVDPDPMTTTSPEVIPPVTPTPPEPSVTPPVPSPVHVAPPVPADKPVPKKHTQDEITAIALQSDCAKYYWKNRGTAPKSYIKGTALVFAKSLCNLNASHIQLISQAKTGDDTSDTLSWYNSNFNALGMTNNVSGVDVLRHVYTLLIGLAQRESSGKYCCGRDMSANYSSANSAEAGIYQASWGASRKSPELVKLFETYKKDSAHCYLNVFKEDVKTCSEANLKNWSVFDSTDYGQFKIVCPATEAKLRKDATSIFSKTWVESDIEIVKYVANFFRDPKDTLPTCAAMLEKIKKAILADTPGFLYQKMSKECPAFATEYAAILLRVHGGTKGEFGPLRRKDAELNPTCDTMLSKVQDLVLSDKSFCDIL